jgi:hypothetical protein
MSGIQFDSEGRDPNGARNCGSCGYAFIEPKCPNPGCRLNMSAVRIAEVEATAAKHRAEDAERAKIRRIQSNYLDSTRRPHGKR